MSDLERLPGRSRGFLTTHLAMLGADHLLLVQRSGYRERYRRIELADVEAWAIEATEIWHRTSVAWGVSALALGAFAVLAGGGFRLFWAILAGAALSGLAVHRVRGPSCRVRLRTPLDWIEVPAWRRLSSAERALERLGLRAAEVQGELGDAEARARLAEVSPLLRTPSAEPMTPAWTPAPVAPGPGSGAAGPIAPRDPRTRWHGRLAALILGGLLLWIVQASVESGALDLVASLYLLLELGVAITALVSQAGSELPGPLKRWTIGSLVALSSTFVVAIYVATFAAAISAGVSGEPAPAFGTPTQLPASVREGLAVGGALVSAILLVAWLAVRPRPRPVGEGAP